MTYMFILKCALKLVEEIIHYTVGCGHSTIKGTSLEETCTFCATIKLPLEESS